MARGSPRIGKSGGAIDARGRRAAPTPRGRDASAVAGIPLSDRLCCARVQTAPDAAAGGTHPRVGGCAPCARLRPRAPRAAPHDPVRARRGRVRLRGVALAGGRDALPPHVQPEAARRLRGLRRLPRARRRHAARRSTPPSRSGSRAAQLALFVLRAALAGTEVALGAALLFAVVLADPGAPRQRGAGGGARVPADRRGRGARAPRGADRERGRGGRRRRGLRGGMLLFKPVDRTDRGALARVARAPGGAARALRLSMAALGGGAAALGACVAYFASLGGLGALWDSTVRFNLGYGTAICARRLPRRRSARASSRRCPRSAPVYAVALLAPLVRRATRAPAALGRDPRRGRRAGSPRRCRGRGRAATSATTTSSTRRLRSRSWPRAGLADLRAHSALPSPAAAPRSVARRAPRRRARRRGPPGLPPAGRRRPEGARALRRRTRSRSRAASRRSSRATRTRRTSSSSSARSPSSSSSRGVANAGRYLLAYHYLLGPPEDALARQREVLTTLRASPPRFVATALYHTSLLEDERTPRAIHERPEALLRASYQPVAELACSGTASATSTRGPTPLAPWRVARPSSSATAPDSSCSTSALRRLLDRDALREVPRLVDVGALQHRHVVGEQLERDVDAGRRVRYSPRSGT